MIEMMQRLGRELSADRERVDGDERRFADLATEALHRPITFDLDDVTDFLLGASELPRQIRTDQTFGQPPITLFWDDKVVVEALLWHTATPAVHQHAFSGAFRVLQGGSVHTEFSFTSEEPADAPVRLGRLQPTRVERLHRGAVRRILPGDGTIHSVHHLDNPTLSLVVRSARPVGREYGYLAPGVAFDPAARSVLLQKRLQWLNSLQRCGLQRHRDDLRKFLADADPYARLMAGLDAARTLPHPEQWRDFLACFTDAAATDDGRWVAALEDERRRLLLTEPRARMAAPDDRVFLAVLSNHRRLEDVLAGLAACGVGHSVCLDLVVQGLRRLLGLTDPRARPVVDFVLHAFLDGVFPDELTARASERPELDRSTHPVLIDLYEQLEQQPIVSELRA